MYDFTFFIELNVSKNVTNGGDTNTAETSRIPQFYLQRVVQFIFKKQRRVYYTARTPRTGNDAIKRIVSCKALLTSSSQH